MNSKAIIFDKSDGQELRINMISPWLKKYFEQESEQNSQTLKIVKLSLDGGFTCPNRDGSKGVGGCCFCSENGSGDMASRTADIVGGNGYEVCGTAEAVRMAMRRQISLLSKKWPEEKYNLRYIAYFQSHTNTYGPVEKLRTLFEAAIEVPGVIGLAIATRSDCISDEVLDLLAELNQKTFMWIELGLQTIHDETAKKMNLCHGYNDYVSAVRRLTDRNIRIVSHLILGLPGETKEMMLDSVKRVCEPIDENERHIFGLKLHMLNVVKGSQMETKYPDYIPFYTMEEYIDLLIRAVEIIPSDITIHRISGDAPRATLIAPEWSYQKRSILNSIHREMKGRNTWQGRLQK